MKQNEIDVTEITRNTYDQIAADYSQKIKQLIADTWVGKFEQSLLDKFINLIIPIKEDIHRILDTGWGYGKDSYYFSRQKGFSATGLDYSAGMLTEARKVFPQVEFVQMDMRNLLFPDNTFSGVWANGCIYHVTKYDVRTVFSEVQRVLKPSGVFPFNFKSGKGEILEQNPKSYGGKPRFYSYYQSDEIHELTKQSGLQVIENRAYPEEIFGEKIQQVWSIKP